IRGEDARLLRGVRPTGRSVCARAGDEEVEPRLEARTDRAVQPGLARPGRGPWATLTPQTPAHPRESGDPGFFRVSEVPVAKRRRTSRCRDAKDLGPRFRG